MEKKEARIKCHGCGTTFKLKVPVSDKPINFTCKKCGKVLKIKLKASPTEEQSPPPEPKASEPVIETNQMGDFADDDFGNSDPSQMPSGEHQISPPQFDESPVTEEDKRKFESTQLPEFEDGEDIGVDLSNPPSQFETGRLDDLELTQLPDEGSYQNTAGAPPVATQSPADAPQQAIADGNRRWIVLDEDLIKGPFSDEEILEMIHQGEVKAETSLRMGERPWIKASEIANFRKYFHVEPRPGADSRLAQFSLLDQEAEDAARAGSGKPFYTELASILPYPIGRGNPVPLAIFAGIVFVLSTILSFPSLQFFIALPINLIGWIILYGYLSQLMNYSKQYPTKAPPAWDFSRVKEMAIGGIMVLLVLLAYSLIPVTISLLLMIFFFLNSMAELGYAFIGLTVVFYVASLYFVPGSLLILEHSGNLGAALNPMKILSMIRKGGKAYRMLAVVSIVAGLACMAITILAVFLTDIPDAGFVVAGLLMALVLSYAHFIWFHVLGRFSTENKQLLGGQSAA